MNGWIPGVGGVDPQLLEDLEYKRLSMLDEDPDLMDGWVGG